MRWIFLAPFMVLSSFCLSTIIGHAQLGITYGDAVNLGGGCYQLTNSSQSQNGAVWYFGTVDVTQSWEMTANLYLGSSDSGADGLVFVLRNIDSSTLGESGEYLGYGAYEYTSQSIQPSIGVEVDTQPNPSQSDPEFDHLAILSNGQVSHSDSGTISAPVAVMPDSSNIEIGEEFELRVTYCASSQLMTVFWDDQQRISEVVDLASIGANPVKWGFTAATGGAFNEHRVCDAQWIVLEVGAECECLDSNMNEICDDLEGCADVTACNFDPAAEADNGTCDYSCCPGPGCCSDGMYWDYDLQVCQVIETCEDDLDGDGVVGVNDLMQLLSSFGTSCPLVEPAEWTCGDPVSYHGYDYETVLIGEQCWFAENLQTTKYANGDDISNLTTASNEEWQYADSGAFSNYQNWNLSEVEVVSLYGRLYNQFAVQDERGLCPNEWHVPQRLEFEEMIESAGGEEAAGDALKSSPEDIPSWTGNNSSGFSGTPGGLRDFHGPFSSFGSQGFWWSQTFTYTGVVSGQGEVGVYWIFRLNNSGVDPLNEPSSMGTSIRCIKD